jgi:hypothetical protein
MAEEVTNFNPKPVKLKFEKVPLPFFQFFVLKGSRVCVGKITYTFSANANELSVSFCCHRCQKNFLFFKGVSALHTPDEETLRWLHVRNAGSGSLETKLELLNNSFLFYIFVKLHSKVLRIIMIGTQSADFPNESSFV